MFSKTKKITHLFQNAPHYRRRKFILKCHKLSKTYLNFKIHQTIENTSLFQNAKHDRKHNFILK